KRLEDPRFLRGRATYIDDLTFPGMLHVAMLRSPHAHARVVRLEARGAGALPGVAAALTGEDVARVMPPLSPLVPIPNPPRTYPLAVGRVRYVCEALPAR